MMLPRYVSEVVVPKRQSGLVENFSQNMPKFLPVNYKIRKMRRMQWLIKTTELTPFTSLSFILILCHAYSLSIKETSL